MMLKTKHLRILEDLVFAARDSEHYDDAGVDEALAAVAATVTGNESARPGVIAGVPPGDKIAYTILTPLQLGERDPRPLLDRTVREVCSTQANAVRFVWRDVLIVALPPGTRRDVETAFRSLYRDLPPVVAA